MMHTVKCIPAMPSRGSADNVRTPDRRLIATSTVYFDGAM